MPKKKPARAKAQASTRKAASRGTTKGFTAEEREAMRDRAREMKAEREGGDAEAAVLAKIATMPQPDRAMAQRVHAIVRSSAPALAPRLWYGMPAYARADGKVVCFFQGAHKFKTRYCTFGFSDRAKLDDGEMWGTGFAIKSLTPEGEARIATLVKRAVS